MALSQGRISQSRRAYYLIENSHLWKFWVLKLPCLYWHISNRSSTNDKPGTAFEQTREFKRYERNQKASDALNCLKSISFSYSKAETGHRTSQWWFESMETRFQIFTLPQTIRLTYFRSSVKKMHCQVLADERIIYYPY